MTRRASAVIGLTALTWLLCVDSGSAQVGTASLVGQVVDQSGAVVPQASLVVRRPSAGFERRVAVGADGAFTIAELMPGDYELTASSDGFSVAEQRVTLRAGETRHTALQLRVGVLTEDRSEEHTSELQSQSNLVCRLLLEKKKYS